MWVYYQQMSKYCRPVLTYWLTDLCHHALWRERVVQSSHCDTGILCSPKGTRSVHPFLQGSSVRHQIDQGTRDRCSNRPHICDAVFNSGCRYTNECKLQQVIAPRDDMLRADRGGSTSVRGRIRSPHSSGGLQGSCGAAGLGAARLGQLLRAKPAGTDRQTDGSRHRSMPPPIRRRYNNYSPVCNSTDLYIVLWRHSWGI